MSIFLGNRKSVLKNQNIPKIDVTKYLKKDGSDAMSGNLDLGNYAIQNLKTYPKNNSDAVSKKYVDDETAKLLDLDANKQMNGDLDMNDNSIIGIYDISADNSVPSKKFVKDEIGKVNTKTSTNKSNITRNKNSITSLNSDITTLKSKPIFSHYSKFLYVNPTKNVFISPQITPAGSSEWVHIFSIPNYNDKTTASILGITLDSDSSVTGSTMNFSVEFELFNSLGGFSTKTPVSSKNIASYRKNSNLFVFDDIILNFKDMDPSNYSSWVSFSIKVALPYTGNESTLYFSINYY